MKEGRLQFTVDSALLKELGERLVGRPSIALAELVKNSYDADATEVTITLDAKGSRIVVDDNGHGMTFEEFRDFWMRIGSTHKKRQRVSRNFRRNMTGTKGIGRLAVQFLANELELRTCSDQTPSQLLTARVNWTEAVRAENLTSATVEYRITEAQEEHVGTKLILSTLSTTWDDKEIQSLARQIWWLQPPFGGRMPQIDPAQMFKVRFLSHQDQVDLFDRQMNAILDIWHARIVGRNDNGHVHMTVEWAGEDPIPHDFHVKDCKLSNGNFEVRIYHLIRRQPRGISVGEAREYLNEYGGVNVYDGGFRLPYYGDKRNDWLEIEQDHSHRKSVSELLPAEIRAGLDRGLQFLPTLSRILGVVNVSTSEEQKLEISITRDRFVHSDAYLNLKAIVRYGIDLYALWEKLRALKKEEAEKGTEKQKVQHVDKVIEQYRSQIPEKTYVSLRSDIFEVLRRTETEAERDAAQIGLWGSLATAGITSLAYQHETRRQLHAVDRIVEEIGKLQARVKDQRLRQDLKGLRDNLSSWIEQARQTNALFMHLGDPENMSLRTRFKARRILEDVWAQVDVLAPGLRFRAERVDPTLLLPKASFAEWSSIFQNVFINAFNAMVLLKRRIIEVSSDVHGTKHEILVQDTGHGIDLKRAEHFFEPFIRESKIPPGMKALGYGGTGLGLSIVRLIAKSIGCEVSFRQPEKGFSTAFSLQWSEVV